MRKQLGKLLKKDDRNKIVYLPLNKIKPNPFQMRRGFDEQQMVDLTRSIMMYGMIQPIVVRPCGKEYEIVTGEMRYRACCLLGKSDIAAIVRRLDDENAAVLSLVENLQRSKLSYWEEAYAYSFFIHTLGITQAELARRIGRSQAAIASKLRLIKLPDYIQSMIKADRLSEGHAHALLKLNSSQLQEEVIREINEKGLSVEETDNLVDQMSRSNMPVDARENSSHRNVSMIIKDARIFVNTIKETAKRARQTGVDVVMEENDNEEQYEIIIRIAKQELKNKPLAKSV